MKYFLHDSNAFQDEKIGMLFDQHGYEGLGLFYTILEKLAYQEKPINTNVLKRQLHVGKKLDKCWKFLEEIELISSNNGETFNENLLKFSEKFLIKSEKNRKRVSQWRENQALTKNVTRTESVCNSPKDKISKDNIIKDNILLEKEPKTAPVFKSENSGLFPEPIATVPAESQQPKEKSSAKKEKVLPHYFEDSPYYNRESFLAYFTPNHYPLNTYPDADLVHYYEKMKRWAEYGSGSKPGKQRSKDWTATARTFMQRDADEGKLRLITNTIINRNGEPTYYHKQQSANGAGADLETAVAMSRLLVSDGYKQAG